MGRYVIFLVCYIVLILILPGFLHIPNYQSVMYIVLGIAGLIISRDELKESGASWKAHPIRNILLLISCFILMQIIDNIAILPYALLYPDQGGTMNENNIQTALGAVNPLVFILGIGVLGPITEETVFRNILTTKLGRFVPAAVAVIVSSLLFGFIHMHALTIPELLSVLPHIFTGILWSVLLIKTKNISLVYALHILNNLPTVILIFLK